MTFNQTSTMYIFLCMKHLNCQPSVHLERDKENDIEREGERERHRDREKESDIELERERERHRDRERKLTKCTHESAVK